MKNWSGEQMTILYHDCYYSEFSKGLSYVLFTLRTTLTFEILCFLHSRYIYPDPNSLLPPPVFSDQTDKRTPLCTRNVKQRVSENTLYNSKS